MIVKIKKTKKWRNIQPFWVTICNSRGRCMFKSEMYKTHQAAQKAVEVLRANGLIFRFKDETLPK